MIDSTQYQNTETVKKRVTLPHWVISALKRWSEPNLTKGLVVYEVLSLTFDEYGDSLDDIEDSVDRDLWGVGGDSLVQEVEKIKTSSDRAGKGILVDNCEFSDPKESKQSTLYLPQATADNLPSWGAGGQIEQALVHVAERPWTSRTDRIQFKQQIVRVLKDDDIDDPHRVVRAVVDDDCSQWGVSDVHDIVVDGREWWERDDVTFDDLLERGDEIPQGARNRVPAIESALQNCIEENGWSFTPEALRNGIRNWFDIQSDATVDTYASEVDRGLLEISLEGVYDVMEDNIARAHDNGQTGPDWHLAGFSEPIADVDREHQDVGDSLDALDEIGARISSARSEDTPTLNRNRDDLQAWVERKRSEIKAHETGLNIRR